MFLGGCLYDDDNCPDFFFFFFFLKRLSSSLSFLSFSLLHYEPHTHTHTHTQSATQVQYLSKAKDQVVVPPPLHLVMNEIPNFGIWVGYHLLNILKCMVSNQVQFIMIQEKKFQVGFFFFFFFFFSFFFPLPSVTINTEMNMWMDPLFIFVIFFFCYFLNLFIPQSQEM